MLPVATQPFVDQHTTHALYIFKITYMIDAIIRHEDLFAHHKVAHVPGGAGHPVTQPVLHRNIKDEVALGAEHLFEVGGDTLPREHARMPLDRLQDERLDCCGP